MTAAVHEIAEGAGTNRRLRLTVWGTVQGVGFRPHVHRLAVGLGLAGLVGNDSGSVFIEVEGAAAAVGAFERDLVALAPPLATIADVVAVEVPVTGADGFRIVASRTVTGPVTTAPPDTAPCADCLRELADPSDRRFRYPFTTCTSCGPRFTIITALPYDRPATTMAGFPLCGPCHAEYGDITDRRFHAQPVACHDCGPRIRLEGVAAAETALGASDAVLAATQAMLADGAIVAIKGVGGFHLACRADDDATVTRLRERKQRPGKPFAVMVRDLTAARDLAHVGDAEADLLTSPAAPIVLLRRRDDATLAASVAPGNPLVGVMLPSSPLHHLLLMPVPASDAPPPGPLVMTSGNLSEEPLCTDDDEARDRLASIADAWLLHDRPIAVPCDDSVVRVDDELIDGQGPAVTVIRRSRGYVPTPLRLPYDGTPALAVGGQLKTTAALTDGRHVWLSPHIGDMGSLATLRAFERTVERFGAMHDFDPGRLVADAHPEYATRRWAHDDGRPVHVVQHHHAHIAAVMAEHGLDGTTPVIGVAFDGTGYGLDGAIWGGEVLLADYDGFERLAHLAAVLLPGGDTAIRHPRRIALSHLRTAGIGWDDDLPPVAATPPAERRLLAQQLDRDLNCVATSSMGRLFDAIASILGVRHDITFEAQGAIELEILADGARRAGDAAVRLSLPLRDPAGPPHPAGGAVTPEPAMVSTHAQADGPGMGAASSPILLDAAVLVRGVVAAHRDGAGPAVIALGVHEAIAEAVVAVCLRARLATGHDVVALSGGVFANALLTRLITHALEGQGFRVLRHRLVPPNDGGLALGQIAVGARRVPPPPVG